MKRPPNSVVYVNSAVSGFSVVVFGDFSFAVRLKIELCELVICIVICLLIHLQKPCPFQCMFLLLVKKKN